MDPSSRTYQCQPLNSSSSLRLISIQPYKTQDRRNVRIHTFSDEEIPPYIAVSYMWGDPDPTRSIQLGNSTELTYKHPMHENLWAILNRLYEKREFEEYFWTDSFCLNQKDNNEKSTQVPRMSDIYPAAKEVFIWLGHDSEGERAMEIVQDCLGHATAIQTKFTPSSRKPAAEHLLRLQYWSRAWIAQEVVRARYATVAYGRFEMTLDSFQFNLLKCRGRDWSDLDKSNVWSLCELRESNIQTPLWELVEFFQLCRSTWFADKIYGALGLSAMLENGESPAQNIGVDYRKRPFEVFWDTLFAAQPPWDQTEQGCCFASETVLRMRRVGFSTGGFLGAGPVC